MTLNRGINKLMDAREGTKLSISVSSGTKGKNIPGVVVFSTNIVLSFNMFTYDRHQLPY